jgi:DNA-binding NarL/FixJ family response regulator
VNQEISHEASVGVVRVLIAEDDPEMQAALTELVEAAPGLDLVGLAGDAEGAAAMAVSCRPDVALLDVRLPAGGGRRAARLIRQQMPEIRLVAFSAYSDRATVLDMLRAGAVEYLVKGRHDNGLIDALQRSGRGQIGLPVGELEELAIELAETLERSEASLELQRADVARLAARLGEIVNRGQAALAAARDGEGSSPDTIAALADCLRGVGDVAADLAALAARR